MHIAILGGAFDPPHFGHMLVAQQVLEQLPVDEVWLMVCSAYFPEFPVKYARISPFQQRFEMASFLQTDRVRVSDFEQKQNPKSLTIDTLQLIHKLYFGDTFSFIIGSDQVKTFHLWNNWQEIIKNHKLIIFPRDTNFETLEERVKNSFKLQTIPKNITVLKNPEIVVSNVSSSLVRKRIRKGLPISQFVIKEVEEYINENKLYG